jgi:sugar phosphate permease
MSMQHTSTSRAQWRGRVFIAAWALYAGYYICRKDMSMIKGSAISSLAVSLACFGGMYAVGQLVGGTLADRIGARRTALAGAGISILCTVSLVWCNQPVLALLLQLGNGFGQGFGWPALLKLLGGWFGPGERDRVLGWWSTSYILGGLLASSLAAWLLLNAGGPTRTGFHPAYLVSSAVLLCSALFFFKETWRLPAAPREIGAPPTSPDLAAPAHPWRQLLSNRRIRVIASMYFFLKMTRYTLLFWLPNYLISYLGYRATSAAHMASYFELFGFLGPLAAAYAVQRYFSQRRMALGAGMLFVLAFLCLVHPMLANSGETGLVLSIALMGILIHGADILMSGMAVLDAVPKELHGRASGLVNAIGSIGQALSPLLVTVYVSHLGWTKLFDLFVFFALVAGAICAFGARNEAQFTSTLNRSALETASSSL